jgi:predicted kinase
VAEELADATGGVVVSSDRLRRTDPPGDAADSSSHDTAGVSSGDEPAQAARQRPPDAPYASSRYSDDARSAVYARMLAEAQHVVSSGRVAILDATYSRRAWRESALGWARNAGCPAILVEVVAPRDEVIERLSERQRAGNDASEAGPGLYDAMRAEREPLDEWPADRCTRIDTSASDWRETVRNFAAAALPRS